MRTALSTSGSVLGAMLSSVKSPVRKHKERFKKNVSREHLNDTTMGGSAGGMGVQLMCNAETGHRAHGK